MELRTELTPKELEELVLDYRLTIEPAEECAYSIPAEQLLDPASCAAYLDKLCGLYGTSSKVVAASLFSKRYAYLTVAPALYAMSLYDKGLELTAGNCMIESCYHNEIWLPKLRMKELQVTQPAPGSRTYWREEILRRMFAGNLALVWNALAQASGIAHSVLWENTAIYVYWLYENKFCTAAQNDLQHIRIQEDWNDLLHQVPGAVFGYGGENPLSKFNNPMVQVEEGEGAPTTRIRTTCCYYYKVSEEGQYCPNCPMKIN